MSYLQPITSKPSPEVLVRAQYFMDYHLLLQILDSSLPEAGHLVGQLRGRSQIFGENEVTCDSSRVTRH